MYVNIPCTRARARRASQKATKNNEHTHTHTHNQHGQINCPARPRRQPSLRPTPAINYTPVSFRSVHGPDGPDLTPRHARTPDAHRLCRGTSGIDIDLRRVDIDQCPQRTVAGVTQPLNLFAGTDKCKHRTTEVSQLRPDALRAQPRYAINCTPHRHTADAGVGPVGIIALAHRPNPLNYTMCWIVLASTKPTSTTTTTRARSPASAVSGHIGTGLPARLVQMHVPQGILLSGHQHTAEALQWNCTGGGVRETYDGESTAMPPNTPSRLRDVGVWVCVFR